MATIRVSRKLFAKNRSIQEAIDHATSGSVIEIEAGLYREDIYINKYVELIGVGNPEETIIQGSRESVINFNTGYAVIRNLTIRQSWSSQLAVMKISQGALIVEDCQIESRNYAAVKIIGDDTEPIFRRCQIHSIRNVAVEIHSKGNVVFEECRLSSQGDFAAVMVINGDPQFRKCTFTGGNGYGIYVEHKGKGRFEECDLFGFDRSPAVGVLGGNPRFVKCKIHDCAESGVAIEEGKGRFEQCRFYSFGKELTAVRVSHHSHPQFVECVFHDCRGGAFLFEESSSGLIDQCELYGFLSAPAVMIFTQAHPQFLRCKIHDGNREAVYCTDEGKGVLESCELSGFNGNIITVANQSRLDILRCKITNGSKHGLITAQKAKGIIRDSYFAQFHHAAAIHVTQVSDPAVLHCEIEDSKEGVRISEYGRGSFEHCVLRNIKEKQWNIEQGNPVIKHSTLEEETQNSKPISDTKITENHTKPTDTSEAKWNMEHIIGQVAVKKQFQELFMYLDYLQDRKRLGIKTTEQPQLDAIFLGPGDTGKKQMAQKYAEMLRKLGSLHTDAFYHATPLDWLRLSSDEMELLWQDVTSKVAGGLLYIDELQQLLTDTISTANVQKWVEEFEKRLSDPDRDYILIIAGMERQTKRWLNNYPKLRTYFTNTFVFEQYTPADMVKIFHQIAKKEDYTVDTNAYDTLQRQMLILWSRHDQRTHTQRVQEYFQQVKIWHSMRCSKLPKEQRTKEMLTTIIREDLRKKGDQDIQPNDDKWVNEIRKY